jgi:hypothetical protein
LHNLSLKNVLLYKDILSQFTEIEQSKTGKTGGGCSGGTIKYENI